MGRPASRHAPAALIPAEQARIAQRLVVRITVNQADLAIDPGHDGLGAIGRAWGWRQRLERGDVATFAGLAADEGLSDRYVSRLLRLAWLAPGVLERLVVHREPSTISIHDLCFVAALPWEEQPGRVFD